MSDMKICLFWHNLNSSNYGVGALGLAHIGMLNSVAKENGVVLEIDTIGTKSKRGLLIQKEIEQRLGIKINHTDFGLREVFGKLISFDWSSVNVLKNKNYAYVLDIGEGDSFADIYGLKRFVIFSLSKYFAIGEGIPLVLAPQTIGPFERSIASWIAAFLMKKAAAVYVRDHKSANYLKDMGVAHVEVSDVAFLLPFDAREKIEDSVGLNVSALLWHGGYTKNNQFNLGVDYRKMVVGFISKFLERDKEVHLISHVISDEDEIEDDYRVAVLIKEQYFKNDSRVIVGPKFKSPIEAKSYISQMRFFIGSRMHATIGALSSGVPTIPLAYSRKFSGVFESINYPYTIDAFGDATEEIINEHVFSSYDDCYAEMCKQGEVARQAAKERLRLYSDFLRGIIK